MYVNKDTMKAIKRKGIDVSAADMAIEGETSLATDGERRSSSLPSFDTDADTTS